MGSPALAEVGTHCCHCPGTEVAGDGLCGWGGVVRTLGRMGSSTETFAQSY